MRNSPYHAIAKWLAEKLKPVQRQLSPRSYRDTFEFIDDIKDLNVNGMVMFSLDVSSLFTNVPVTETVDYLCDFLSASQQEIGIPTNTLKELLLRCTLNVQSLFDNQLYRQVDGVAMGSPLGPLLADVFMGKLERFQLSEQIDKLKHYGRYVDDIFAIATAETDVATLLDAANQAHPSIKFTLEMETAGSLPFLDVLLSRRPDGSVRRSVYRKKTWSGQYTNFASFVPLQQKRNLVRCLAQRARKICSTDSIEEEFRKIQEFLRENGYPERFIEKNIAERPSKPATPTAEKKTLFLKVPFQGDAASELLRRRLDQAVSRTFPAARVQIAFSTNPILRGEAVVERELQNLKEAKSSGPDNIPAKFLKELANELSKPLANIFRSSFELGRLPSEWKTADIFPIYKGGARTNANNYRTVSLTCICCKIMEAIVNKATMKFLEQNHLLSDLQHGFRQNRSCLSSLLLSTEQWTRALDEDGRVDVIYTDFKKAFDIVPHKRLIYTLSEFGIRGRLLTWIRDFLTGRSQTVCVDASRSTPTPVLSGVPQGSVLGPLLFLVYINDCIDNLGCSAIMFADDVKLWRAIRSDADRQLRGDPIQTYRIVRGRECALDFDEFFELAGTDRLRGHPFKLQRKLAHSDVRRNAFSHRVIGAWNGFPDAVVLSETVESFKFARPCAFNSFNPMPDEEETSLLLPDGRKLDELRVADLKKELENRGLNKSGVKKELVQRLAECLSNSGDVLASEKNVDGESKSQQLQCATPDKIDVPNSESLLENETPVSEPTEVEINGVHEVEAATVTGDLSPSHAIQELPPSLTEPSLPKPVEPAEDLLSSSALISRPSVTRVDSATAELEAEEEDYEDENMDVIPPPEPVPAPEPSARSSQTTLQPHDASNQRSTDALAKSPAPSPAPSVKPPPPAASATSSKPPKETRGIGYLAEGPERIEPSAENRHPPTELVYIRFLMRPFTPGQLSKMIESQFGKVCELWLDRIKSSAVVRMENQEAAKSCREGIDGCRWPSINPRILRCDFASEALLAWLKEHGDSGDRNPPRHLLIGAPPPAEKVDSHAPADKSHSSQRKRTSSTSGEKSSSRTLAGAHTERRRKHTEGTSPAKVDGTTGNLPSNTARVIVASSDGRFVICGASPRPKSASQTQTFDLLPLVTFRLANAGESAASLVSLDHRVCLGVVNSTGSNQLVTLKWHLSSEAAAATPLDDTMLNAQLGTNAQSLPGASGAPSGPIIMSTIYETFFWLGTAGGGTLHCFDLSSDDFVSNLSLPPDSPCLHAVAVGPAASASEARLIWLAVSGSSQVSLPHLDEKAGPPCGPHSRLLSVCSSRRVFLHCVDLTALLVSRIDMSDVVDPVDLTVCRLFVQGDECIWFATRCGLIGRFFHNYLLNHESSDAPVDRKDSVSLSCHGYKRPVSALIPIGHVGQDSEGTPVPADRRTPANTPHSLLERAPLGIDGCQLEKVDSFKYLGARLLPNAQSKDDIVSRIDAARWAFSSLRKCPWIRRDLSIATKMRVYRASVQSVLLYGCECCALRVEDERTLEVFEPHCLRIILRVKFTDFVSNETVHARCDDIARITEAIQERRLRWFGHVLRRPPQDLSVAAPNPAPLPRWGRRRGGQLKTWLETVRQDMEVVLGPSVFGLRRCEESGLSCPDLLSRIVTRGEVQFVTSSRPARPGIISAVSSTRDTTT
ncbi:hypothetical protein SprV_0802624100 [Sparganum proliferum]